jgi:serine/threonine-protein kinase
VFHRDLKPDNIFLTPRAGWDDFVKVLDFGIAKLARPMGDRGPLTLRGQVMGTPGYMSPEQGTGGTVDGRTDVYALGVLLFRMLGGRLPYEAATIHELIEMQLAKKAPQLAPLRPDVPASLGALVSQMLQRQPDKRVQTMREVQERLVEELRAIGAGTSPSGRMRVISDGWRSVPPTHLNTPRAASAVPHISLGAKLAIVGGACAISAGLIALAVLLRGSHAPAHATPPAPIAAKPPKPAPPAPAPVARTYPVHVETRPQGAEIWDGMKLLGTTPAELTLEGDRTLRLHREGWRDEELQVNRSTVRVLVPMLKLGTAAARTRPPTAPPPAHATHKPPPEDAPPDPEPGSGLGLND